MRRMLSLVIVLAVAGCGDSGTTTIGTAAATVPPPADTTSTIATTTTVAPTSAPTTEPVVTEADPPEDGAAAFAITQVSFGDSGFVQVTNVGNAPGDPGGHWLCQRPVYFEIPSIELGPGEALWIAAGADDLAFVGPVVAAVTASGRLGTLASASGEIGLYRSNDFGSADAIVDYVEWGSAGHGRSGVAADAGIWTTGSFVEIPEGTIAIIRDDAAGNGPETWSPDIGV